MRFRWFSTILKLLTFNEDGTTNPDAVAASTAILKLHGGKQKIKQLFYGVDTEKKVRYDTPAKLAALWVRVDRNIGRLVQEMQWQSNRVDINGGKRRNIWRVIRR